MENYIVKLPDRIATRSEIVKLHRDMWSWIADKTEEREEFVGKHDYQIEVYPSLEFLTAYCFCCEYDEDLRTRLYQAGIDVPDCGMCPLKWRYCGKNGIRTCYYTNNGKPGEFVNWGRLRSNSDFNKAASYARVMADVPEVIVTPVDIRSDISIYIGNNKYSLNDYLAENKKLWDFVYQITKSQNRFVEYDEYFRCNPSSCELIYLFPVKFVEAVADIFGGMCYSKDKLYHSLGFTNIVPVRNISTLYNGLFYDWVSASLVSDRLDLAYKMSGYTLSSSAISILNEAIPVIKELNSTKGKSDGCNKDREGNSLWSVTRTVEAM